MTVTILDVGELGRMFEVMNRLGAYKHETRLRRPRLTASLAGCPLFRRTITRVESSPTIAAERISVRKPCRRSSTTSEHYPQLRDACTSFDAVRRFDVIVPLLILDLGNVLVRLDFDRFGLARRCVLPAIHRRCAESLH